MSDPSNIVFLFLLGANHATHIGDIIIVYTIDRTLNLVQTGRLFLYTVLTHTVNLMVIFLAVRFIVSVSPGGMEMLISKGTGGAVALLGAYILGKRIRERPHDCTHHAHETTGKKTSLLGMGILSGLIPCGEVVAIGLLSSSLQHFLTNMTGFLGGLGLTLAALMTLGATVGKSLQVMKHRVWIRILGPLLLIGIGLYRILI